MCLSYHHSQHRWNLRSVSSEVTGMKGLEPFRSSYSSRASWRRRWDTGDVHCRCQSKLFFNNLNYWALNPEGVWVKFSNIFAVINIDIKSVKTFWVCVITALGHSWLVVSNREKSTFLTFDNSVYCWTIKTNNSRFRTCDLQCIYIYILMLSTSILSFSL